MKIDKVLTETGEYQNNVFLDYLDELADYLCMESFAIILNYIEANKDKIPEDEMKDNVYNFLLNTKQITIDSVELMTNDPEKYSSEWPSVLHESLDKINSLLK